MLGVGPSTSPTSKGKNQNRISRWMAQTKTSTNRERKRKLIALFSWLMFLIDVGSDMIVGFDLLNRCHLRAGWTVLGKAMKLS